MMRIEHNGYTAVCDLDNKHIRVYENEHLIFHSESTEERTEKDLLNLIDCLIKFRSGELEASLEEE